MLKLENVTKYYHNNTNVTCALHKVNLEFKKGEFVVITGESGSGKTTLLNIISGLDSYEDGEMYFNNKETSYFDDSDWEKYRKDEIAFIFQNYNLIDSYTVLENVMVTYTIAGYSLKEAKEKAIEVLKLVGLESHINQKATQLSGGQKQKVAIARALAKETNIIIADEPTGNLDTENSIMVLDILKQVSKDKLVIVVSHNQNIIDPYMTRKIRLRDGEVVSDEVITKINSEKNEEKDSTIVNNKYKNLNFLFLNMKSQPKKSILLLLLITFNIIASFVCLVNLKTNIDDKKTKNVSNQFFNNLDDTRLLIKRKDGSSITDEMLKCLDYKYILSYDKYDYITDVNYYRPEDYKYRYAGGTVDTPDGGTSFVDSSNIIIVNKNKYMRSTSSLTPDMLKGGRLPENSCEMVVYSDSLDVIGTEELVLFRNAFKWGSDTWYTYNVKIVGVLKEDTEQTYFSDDLCKVMELTNYPLNIRYDYSYQEKKYSIKKGFFTFDKIVMVDWLLDDCFQFSDPCLNHLKDKVLVERYPNTTIYYEDSSDVKRFDFFKDAGLEISDNALGVSPQFFYSIFYHYEHFEQAAVYVTDYAYVDEVLDYLDDEGYDAISCFQASVTGYNKSKVIIRVVNLAASALGILIINAITIFVAYSFLKIKKNDYIIFKMIGLSNKDSKTINRYELLVYTLIGNILLVITTVLIGIFTNNKLILELYKYLKFYDYFIILFITILSSLQLSKLFGNFISRSAKITVLKEE